MLKTLTLALVMLFGSHFAGAADETALAPGMVNPGYHEARAAALRAKGEQVELMK